MEGRAHLRLRVTASARSSRNCRTEMFGSASYYGRSKAVMSITALNYMIVIDFDCSMLVKFRFSLLSGFSTNSKKF
jgi:hypothetical protein